MQCVWLLYVCTFLNKPTSGWRRTCVQHSPVAAKRHDVARVRVRLLSLEFVFCLLRLDCDGFWLLQCLHQSLKVKIPYLVIPRQVSGLAPFAAMLRTASWIQLPFLNFHFNLHRENSLRTNIDDTVLRLWPGHCYCTSWPALPRAFLHLHFSPHFHVGSACFLSYVTHWNGYCFENLFLWLSTGAKIITIWHQNRRAIYQNAYGVVITPLSPSR